MNRWHRLHSYFRKAKSMEDAIMLSINGLDPPVPGINYPNIAARFARYVGWLDRDDCLSMRFEDLVSEQQPELIRPDCRVLCSLGRVRRSTWTRAMGTMTAFDRAAKVAHVPQWQESGLAEGIRAGPPFPLRRAGGRFARPLGLRAKPRIGRGIPMTDRIGGVATVLLALALELPMKIIVHDYAGHPVPGAVESPAGRPWP